jgi:hypothetical protein
LKGIVLPSIQPGNFAHCIKMITPLQHLKKAQTCLIHMSAVLCCAVLQVQYVKGVVLPSIQRGGLPALVVSHGLAIKW